MQAIFFMVGENTMLFSSLNCWDFILLTILLCLLGRAGHVFPLSYLYNCTQPAGPPHPLSFASRPVRRALFNTAGASRVTLSLRLRAVKEQPVRYSYGRRKGA